jgi:hypothetical protein
MDNNEKEEPARGEHLDLSVGEDHPAVDRKDARRFIGIQFACCRVYARIYVNKDETAYEGRCPKCCRQVRILIGPGGTDERFFTAY